jgi:hypothetical protein
MDAEVGGFDEGGFGPDAGGDAVGGFDVAVDCWGFSMEEGVKVRWRDAIPLS